MRLTARFIALFVCLAAPASVTHAQRAGPAQSETLTQAIAAQDAALFDALFNRCDPDAIAAIVTDDFEFFHDKYGESATSGAQFVSAIRDMCERQRTGEDYRARRELISGSLQVYPINAYGAVELGEHRFFKLENGGERLVEESRFVNLWKLENGHWRLSRALSYGHQLTPGG